MQCILGCLLQQNIMVGTIYLFILLKNKVVYHLLSLNMFVVLVLHN
jgi:hypothetical protein